MTSNSLVRPEELLCKLDERIGNDQDMGVTAPCRGNRPSRSIATVSKGASGGNNCKDVASLRSLMRSSAHSEHCRTYACHAGAIPASKMSNAYSCTFSWRQYVPPSPAGGTGLKTSVVGSLVE